MSTQRSRVAAPAIQGYLYQFDYSVLRILAAGPDQIITVEGIEDLDVVSAHGLESVQCKYYLGSKYSLPGLRDFILPMLHAFAAGLKCEYRIYAHYGIGADEGVPESLDLAALRQCLTETKRKPPGEVVHHDAGFDEETLLEFSQSLRLIAGPSLDEQRLDLGRALQAAFQCSDLDAAELYYPRALSRVIEMSIQKDEHARTVNKVRFVLDVDCKQATFTRWQEEFIDAQSLLAAQRRRVARAGLFEASRKCVIVLDARLGVHMVALLRQLAERMSPAKRNTSNHAPFTVLLSGSAAEVRLIKTALLENEIWINDGYEEISFIPAAFNDAPVVNTRPGSALISRVSYKLRLIRLETYVANCPALQDHYGALAFGVDLPECLKARSAVVSMSVATGSIEEVVSFLKEFL